MPREKQLAEKTSRMAPSSVSSDQERDEKTERNLSRQLCDSSLRYALNSKISSENDDANLRDVKQNPPEEPVILSNQRWLILAATCMLGLAIYTITETRSILHLFLDLLKLHVDKYIYLQQILYYYFAAMAVPSAWLVDKYGIRAGIYLGALAIVAHGIFRALLYYPRRDTGALLQMSGSSSKIPVYICGTLFGIHAELIFLLLPMKISEIWFPEHERSLAWAIMFTQMSLASLVASLLYPRLIHTLSDMKILAGLSLALPALAALLALTCVTRSKPKHPPSKRMEEASRQEALGAVTYSYVQSYKRMLGEPQIILHLGHFAVFEAIIVSSANVLQDILTSTGHSERFAGDLMAANSFIHIVIMLGLATHTHKVVNATRICKLSAFSQGAMMSIYLIALAYSAPSWLIIGLSIVLSLAKSWAAPNFNSMNAQLASGVVQQATIVGFMMVLTFITITTVQVTFAALIKVEAAGGNNYSKALLFLIIISILNEIIYLLFFGGPRERSVDESDAEIVAHQEEELAANESAERSAK